MAQHVVYRIDMDQRSRWEIISANVSAKQNVMYMQEAGLFYSGPAYYTTRENLDSFLIKLTLAGKGQLTYKEKIHEISVGDFFWIDCKEYQDYRTAEDPGYWHVLWLHFYGANAGNYYALFQQLNQGCPVGHLADIRKAKQIMELLLELYEESSGELTVDLQGANLLTQLLSVFLEAVSVPYTPKIPVAVSAIRDYLFENYAQSITLDELSQRFSISKFHLLRTFRQHLGLTPNEYLQNIRITKAKELLRTTNLAVSMIANMVGIDSTSYFIAAFKKQEGITPHKYRTAWANDLSV